MLKKEFVQNLGLVLIPLFLIVGLSINDVILNSLFIGISIVLSANILNYHNQQNLNIKPKKDNENQFTDTLN